VAAHFEAAHPSPTRVAQLHPVEEVSPWQPFEYASGTVSEYLEVNGDIMRCVAEGCEYVSEAPFRGVHLHEAQHTGKADEMRRQGVETRKASEAEKRQAALTSLATLAAPYGFLVVTKEQFALIEKGVEAESLRSQLDEARSKLDLIREATGL
jgi:hypothetical protein